ncbi:MAG: diaminopimelate epimerase [Lachnospiraceae bacterium]|nr:diaminopimelate epimerase [Lachnospiraceae bacterium]
MSDTFKFTKMQGCGNDYVYVDCTRGIPFDPVKTAIKVSNRNFGIGSDGLILICASDKADFRMRMYNADGSESEMCGNGIRCVGKFVYDKGLTDKTKVTIETGAGIKILDLNAEGGKVVSARVDMGEPILASKDVPVVSENEQVIDEEIEVLNKTFNMTCVSMGNPHAVVFVDDTKNFDLYKYGPAFESHSRFPRRTNTEFVQILSRNEANMRVWERGSGETLACGTGTCASVVAAFLNGLTERKVLVHLLGGDLLIEYDETTGHVFMTGPAVTVFEGEITL